MTGVLLNARRPVRWCTAGVLAVMAMSAAISAETTQGITPPRISVDYDAAAQTVRVLASIDIPAPRPVVWRVMNDCTYAFRIVSGLKTCRILEMTRSGDIREHVINPAFPLPEIRSVFRSDYIEPRLIRFRQITGDYVHSNGEWRLELLGTGTRVVYDAALALTIPLPAMLIRAKIRSDFLVTLRALRREAVAAAAK
ncbi:MAG: hypothetical protein A4S15_13150 [Candidatus Raskinella chloraquaticus]|uniref:Coenzyme Q-binding protein COQ10 START domain-containing protein n=3 Tax=Candidatus Raskinella chloraquaticus TaxID=1951219 RepID=A0A1W9HU19_9HYPH|nr:MAG: hypothetical protein A4S15_13150 [Proteobacteria bacterium SG_bin8]